MPEYNLSEAEIQNCQETMAALADWYTNEYMPAVRAYLDAVTQWYNDVLAPALQELVLVIARFFVGLRRGLLLWRWVQKWGDNRRLVFPWCVWRRLARRWPERWLPRFQEGDDLVSDIYHALFLGQQAQVL
jgi:hypothetical protein